jgi:hypothetical protein
LTNGKDMVLCIVACPQNGLACFYADVVICGPRSARVSVFDAMEKMMNKYVRKSRNQRRVIFLTGLVMSSMMFSSC